MDELKQWFSSQFGLNVREDWLRSNINQVSPNNCRDSLYQLFLHSDIRHVSAGYFNHAHNTNSTIQLHGKICLQIDSLIDIGRSKYSQLRQLQGQDDHDSVEADNDKKWEPKPTRMLLLTLNDGIRDIEAMEYQPIPELTYKTPIGAKIIIIGPVTIRSKIILLKGHNVRLLGGNLPNLDGKGHEDKLQQLLNLPSDHPLAKKIDQKPSLLLSYTNLTNDTPPTNKSNTNFNQKPYSFSNNAPQQTRSNSNSTSNQAVSDQMYKKEDVFVVDDFDDADLLAVDEDIFMHDFQKQDSHDLQKRDSRDFGKQDSQTKVKIEDYGTKRKHPPVSETLSSNTANFSQHTQHVTIKSEVEEIAIEALDKQNTKQISMVKSENPVIYYLIAIENDLRSNKITFPFTFHVKAYFSTLLSPLKSHDQWHVKARINDGTNYLDIDVSDQVLSQMIGFSAKEFNKLKSAADVNKRKQVQQGLQNCQQTLSQINCVMEIVILNQSAVPLLVQLKQSTIYNMKNLITRVKNCYH